MSTPITNIHAQAAASLPADHIGSHESDLYLKVTPEATALVEHYQFRSNVEKFRSNIDGTFWYDIPFAFTPYWNAKEKQA